MVKKGSKHQGARCNVSYTLTVLSAFDDLRRDAIRDEQQYFERLTSFADYFQKTLISFPERSEPIPFVNRLKAKVRTWAQVVVGSIKFVGLLPSFVVQARQLARTRKCSATGTFLAIGIASNRLTLSEHVASPRENLALLARSLGSRSNPRETIPMKIRSADYILLCDALPISRLWKHRTGCWQEDVMIIDGAFLGFVFCIATLGSLSAKCMGYVQSARECYSTFKALQGVTLRQFVRATTYALIADTYLEVLHRCGCSNAEAVFFTSNSTLTELLRACLLQWRGCGRIYEIMHGVGSVQAQNYFAAVLAAARELGSYEKHWFIPQVPRLPLWGVFQRQQYTEEIAINAYVNKYFIGRWQDFVVDEGFIESEYMSLRSGLSQEDEPVILTVFGYYPNDPRGVDAPEIRVERFLISRIMELGQLMKSQCLVIYVPHPSHLGELFTQGVFGHEDIRIYRDSVFCWLISDLCVSLASSAMFEAAYFGCCAFTPLVASDGVFTAQYLNRINHPKSGSREDCVAELRNFMVGYVKDPAVDVVGRARQRLELMVGGMCRDRVLSPTPCVSELS